MATSHLNDACAVMSRARLEFAALQGSTRLRFEYRVGLGRRQGQKGSIGEETSLRNPMLSLLSQLANVIAFTGRHFEVVS
jgi:hypothetical protein